MANIERVKAVVEHIETQLAKQKQQSSQPVTNLLSFDMGEWFAEKKGPDGNICGTTMCLAGWGAHFAGKKMVRMRDGFASDVFVEDVDGHEEIEAWASKFFDFNCNETEVFYQTHIQDTEELKSAINYHLDEEVFEGVEDYYDIY